MLRRVVPTRAYYLRREIFGGDAVLDLGCGNSSPLQFCRTRFRVGVDLFWPYLVEARRRWTHDAFILGDISRLSFREKSFDVVALCDVIEHMPKEMGQRLLMTAEEIARRKVIVMTPNGYLKVDATSGNAFEEHVSGWRSSELKALGYRVRGLQGLHACWRPGGARVVPMIMWAAIAYCGLQPIAYHFPRVAHDLLAVKSLETRKV